MDEDEFLVEDALFLALTRPTMWLGVPVEATLLIGMASVGVLMVLGNPVWALAIGGALLGAARLIVRTDYNMFKILLLFGQTKLRAPNRALWGGSSYSPLLRKGIVRKGFFRG
ncbi:MULTISPECIES: VirB3 family type IV secretion system protein [unclassified Novosphingobium]|uniref:type IV secretion system protein VirB3 n=1 Tax=unclassified Novosphingobium TaxID=2644732 RepID=UPI00146A0528|nr:MULTISPECIES: VirB3 family type IV secretion system protein [unclassified Novosphingobium]NMN07549.1 type IV secretion system protein VirB3 [Novosphingobium sp. SG919]NMN89848.1 type IV secretion system protein VirB3 [Novosphingobium sp. SG916]